MKVAVVVVLAISVAFNLYLSISLVDTAAELDDVRMEQVHEQQAREMMLKVLNEILRGRSVGEIESLGNTLAKRGVIYDREGDDILIGDALIEVSDGRVAQVKLFE
jgi:hypothetical protein